ncbi:hypothetical protein ABZ816_25575 [Actinosynnema sp. NPDC047251]|uniref:Putative membrane protein n=1 Tax=Saccharothrix espanaensis (strain ATCC 51144 / DSM 44229 / JCM 9112 / NBRC 15066 / NRRL 15764) TaxID=1179773 RepID=K0K0B8_SACES|nr:hypothetical protein [Saccharothrix espanaensis]CCH31776.1 putative membrane protein [Saccharothrix espanaensis DSM 44229]
MPSTSTRSRVRKTEHWFVGDGTPTMIEGYGFDSHVLPRMLPALGLVTLASLAWLVPLKSAGAQRWYLLAVVLGATVATWVALRLVVRRLPRLSRPARVLVLVVYAVMPVAVPLLQLVVDDTVTPPAGSAVGLLGFVIFFAAVFAGTLLATTYGLGRLLRRAVRHTVYDLRNSVQLLGRALPAMLFVTLFLFFTGELWQAMNNFAWWRLTLVVVLFGAITVLAAAARLRDETGRVEQELSPERLTAACLGTPLAGVAITEPLRPTPLTGRQNRNLLLMLATRQLVQAALVGLALFAFFLVLGLLVVTPETAEQWIGSPPNYSKWLPAIPTAMLRNATLFAAFGSMYFAITSMSDADHRKQFFAPIIDEVERTLAVRAVYLSLRDRA